MLNALFLNKNTMGKVKIFSYAHAIDDSIQDDYDSFRFPHY